MKPLFFAYFQQGGFTNMARFGGYYILQTNLGWGGEGGRTIFPPLDEFYTLKNYLIKNLLTLAPFKRCLFLGFSGNRNFQITCFNNLRKFLSKVISIERLRTTRLNIYKFLSKEISKERLRTSRFNNIHKFFLVQFQRKGYVHHA